MWIERQIESGNISIHTLHTEGDPLFAFFHPLLEISIHTLHTEGDKF